MKNFDDCFNYINDLIIRIKEIIIKYYENDELIRYIYGQQLNLFYSCFKVKEINELKPLLKFITNDQINLNENLNELNFIYNQELNKEDKYICLLENIKNFLSIFLTKNNLQL